MTDHPERPTGPRPLPFDSPADPADDSAPGEQRRADPPRPTPSRGAGSVAPDVPVGVADDRQHPLDPRSVTASRAAGLIWAGALALLGLIPTILIPWTAGFGAMGWLTLAGAWLLSVAALTTLILVWPGVRYRHASYRVNERGVQIRSGVLFRSVVSVPRSRVQHTDVSRGPIERNFGLATLVIHTAGTQHAAVPLSGLSERTADAIRDYLIEGDGDGDDDAV